jgi:hypothetical protein
MDLDGATPVTALRLVVTRRCHFRVQVESAPAAKWFQVLDAHGATLDVMQIGTDGYSRAPRWSLEHGRSGVLSVSEKAIVLVLQGEKGELVRLPLRFVPGEVTTVRY